MGVKEGWRGRVFEDFAVGDIYEHPLGRTVIDADNIWFSCMTMNTNPIHFDGEYASRTEFGRRLMNSCFTLALVTGQSVTDLTQNAWRTWMDDVRLPNPLFEDDTVYSRIEVLRPRVEVAADSGHRARPATGLNQHGLPRHRVPAHVHGAQARSRAARPAVIVIGNGSM